MASLENKDHQQDENPYVGPRTFTAKEANKFFGRDREARNLIALTVSERIVLFYAQSGAGKSSLINTKIVPGLAAEGFEVLPIGSVRGQSGFYVEADNIFIYNLIAGLQQHGEELPEIEHMTLSDFLDCLVLDQGSFYYDCQHTYPAAVELKPRVLLIDQFEEILTTNTPFWEHREDFFKQLNQALALDEQLWVLLTMREDFLGGLDPYLHHLPDALLNHFYMQHLTRDEALEAICKPVEQLRPFEDDAAETLVDNLRSIQLEGQEETHLGEFVEPVQLQAVCYQMWERLKEQPGSTISKEDVEKYADVDTALIKFYEDTIAITVAETGVSEIELRNWFDTDLVTEAGTRNMVYRGDEMAGNMRTDVADYVNGKFIIREISRPGGIWYELIHDRFVDPISKSNQQWLLDQPLIKLCQEWEAAGRTDYRLLEGRQLAYFLSTNWQALGPVVAEFIAASQTAKELQDEKLAAVVAAARQRELEQQQALAAEQSARAEEAEHAAARQKKLTRIAFGVVILAVIASIAAIFLLFEAQKNAAIASSAAEVAAEQATEAFLARSTADAAQITAEAAAAVANAQRNQLQTQVAEIGTAQAVAAAREDELNSSLVDQAALLEQLLAAAGAPTPTIEDVEDETPVENTPSPVRSTPTAVYQDYAAQLEEVRVQQTAVALYSSAPQTFLLGSSVEAVPIEAVRFGNGSEHIILVGGIHSGKSPSTVEMAWEMIEYFSQNPQEVPENVSLYVIPDLNPDSIDEPGSIEGRLNANGVDLNRNWDCFWEPDPQIGRTQLKGGGGTKPLSEPETRALADFIREIRPTAVVVWYAKATGGLVIPGGCPKTTVSEPLLELYAGESGYDIGEYNTGEVLSGDSTNWMDSVGIPSIGVLLPSHDSPDLKSNLPAVLALLEIFDRQQSR